MSTTDSNTAIFHGRKKLGLYLLEAGLIDENTLVKALELQKTEKKRLGQVIIEMKAVRDEELAKVLSDQLKIPLVIRKKLKQ